ncbi:TetR/AcrR family transcriptional regulator [Algoriphagus vanfongensis]|uniref:TetR/AcrR family transcriptional regulator n=1 Tax=Algoriphagus vanfongensis TaxID=426371 RepID=UPI00041C06E6|nr:TetR/AcrR family transcriptional regulator [Algoriphagus vanfongensis]
MSETKKLKTKDKILVEAIRLYNEFGIQNVTSRHIAGEMGISHGNLDYHYKTKEDIILAIYKKMRVEMSNSYGGRKVGMSSLEHFHLLLLQLEEFQYKFRFFNLDVLEVSRSYPTVSQIIQETFVKRRQTTIDLFKEFIKDGYMRELDLPAIERLEHTIRMVITFWLSQREVMVSYNFTEKGEMIKTIYSLINPYLTEEGFREQKRATELFGLRLSPQ